MYTNDALYTNPQGEIQRKRKKKRDTQIWQEQIVTFAQDDVDSGLNNSVAASVGKALFILDGKEANPSTASFSKPATGTAISKPNKPPT